MKHKRVVIGVDSGDDVTTAQIASLTGTVLAEYSSNSTNIRALTPKQASQQLNSIFSILCKKASTGLNMVQTIVVGLPGCRSNYYHLEVKEALEILWKKRKRFPKHLYITYRTQLIYEKVFGSNQGIIAICDNGTTIYGKDAGGREYTVGGWGYFIDDACTEEILGIRALQLIGKVFDGRLKPMRFFELFRDKFSVDTPENFAAGLHDKKFPHSEVVPLLFESANQRDFYSLSVVEKGANSVVEMIRHVVTRFPLKERIPVVLVGRLFEKNEIYRSLVKRKLTSTLPQIKVKEYTKTPVSGATQAAINIAKNQILSSPGKRIDAAQRNMNL